MASPHTSNAKGSLLIELGIAIALFSLTVTAYFSYALSEQNFIVSLSKMRQALFASASQLEEARALAALDPLSITSTLTFQNNATTTRTVRYVSPCLIDVTSETALDSANAQSVALGILIPDKDQAQALDYDCELGHAYPKSAGGPQVSTLHLSATSTAFDVVGDFVFVSLTDASGPSIGVFKNEAASLSEKTSLPVGTSSTALDATRSHIYSVSKGPTHQLTVVNIESKENPQVVGSYSLPGVGGSYPNGLSVLYHNSKIYVGTHRTQGREFHIYDATQNTLAWLGALELNHNINSIYIREPYAFLGTSGNTENIIVVNIEDPAHPRRIASLAFPGTEDTLSLYALGTTLLVGRKKNTNASRDTLVAVDVSDPLNPTLTAKRTFENQINSIRASDPWAFVGSTKSVLGFDFHSNTSTPMRIFTPETPIALDREGDTLYALSPHSISLITFSP